MKNIHFFLLFVIGLLLININCVGNPTLQTKQSDNPSMVQIDSIGTEKAIIQMLKAFYTEYITASCQFPVNEYIIDHIKEKYCTTNLLKIFQNDDEETMLDADPFLNAQDCDIRTLKSLQIEKDTRPNIYKVTYKWPEGNLITVYLGVVEMEGTHKIDAFMGR